MLLPALSADDEAVADFAVEGDLDGVFGILGDEQLPLGVVGGLDDDLERTERVAGQGGRQDLAWLLRGDHFTLRVQRGELRINVQRLGRQGDRREHNQEQLHGDIVS